MAKPSLFKSLKFRKLLRATGLPKAHAVGLLECLWHVGYESGADTIGTADDVELAAEWEGEPGKLTPALLEAGFIDATGDGRYRIHDFYDHAPGYVAHRKRAGESRTQAQQKRTQAHQKRTKAQQKRTEAHSKRTQPHQKRTQAQQKRSYHPPTHP